MSIAPEHVAVKDIGDLVPGEAEVRMTQYEDGTSGPRVWFGCPRGRGACGVPCKPSPPNSRGCSWDLTGPDNAPTLTPSVNCDQGCGFHGWVKDGKVS